MDIGRILRQNHKSVFEDQPFKSLFQRASTKIPRSSITFWLQRSDKLFSTGPPAVLKPWMTACIFHICLSGRTHNSSSWEFFEGLAIHQVVKVNTFKQPFKAHRTPPSILHRKPLAFPARQQSTQPSNACQYLCKHIH